MMIGVPVAVSYTHLDVYKRQIKAVAGGDDRGAGYAIDGFCGVGECGGGNR